METQLFVIHRHASFRPHLQALVVHGLNDGVPPLQTFLGVVEIKPGHRDLPGDDGIDHGPAVPDHQDKLGPGEDLAKIHAVFHGEGVLVTEPVRRLAVALDDLADEGGHGGVEHLVTQPGLRQPGPLPGGLSPLHPRSQNPRHHPSFLATSDAGVCVQHYSGQRGPAAGQTPDEDQRSAALGPTLGPLGPRDTDLGPDFWAQTQI